MLIHLDLVDSKLIIPEQINPITYYCMLLSNNHEIQSIQSNLKNNQNAIILLELSDLSTNEKSSATILPMVDNRLVINYNQNIILNSDRSTAMLKIYNIHNLTMVECVPFYTF